MALGQRDREGHPPRPKKHVHHSDTGSQYTSFRLAEHLDAAKIAAFIGSVGDAYDCHSFRTGSRKDRVALETLSQVELAPPNRSTGTATADSTVR